MQSILQTVNLRLTVYSSPRTPPSGHLFPLGGYSSAWAWYFGDTKRCARTASKSIATTYTP
ncbi:MAG: hypothetical protein FWG87_02360 [Defluviitaleaceae bacterium]|nr:hypothetical protein [Defluviitaleaceae bacterium]